MRSSRKAARAIATWLLRIAVCVFFAFVAIAVTVLIVVPRATHGVALTVLTGSMTPGIPVGSVVIDRPVDPGTLRVGDVATYQKAPGVDEYITHRIIAIDAKTTPTTFVFKGDANRGPDLAPVPANAIRGRVWFHVPYLGAVRDAIKGGFGRMLLLIVAVLGLGGYAVRQFASVRQQRRRGPDLIMRFALDSFGDVDPIFVADLLGGECEVCGDTFFLRFAAPLTRLAVVRDMLSPHGVEIPAVGVTAAAADGPSDAGLERTHFREPVNA